MKTARDLLLVFNPIWCHLATIWRAGLVRHAAWFPSQYTKRRLFVRSREVSKSRDWCFKLLHRFEIWQAHRQPCCRSACQISERSDNSKYKSRGFETLRDLTERRLIGYWDGALVRYTTVSHTVCTPLVPGWLYYHQHLLGISNTPMQENLPRVRQTGLKNIILITFFKIFSTLSEQFAIKCEGGTNLLFVHMTS